MAMIKHRWMHLFSIATRCGFRKDKRSRRTTDLGGYGTEEAMGTISVEGVRKCLQDHTIMEICARGRVIINNQQRSPLLYLLR